MAFKIHPGNRLESLAELFRRQIYCSPPKSVFTPETVVVQTGGMELFLRKFLARNGGIAAQLEFDGYFRIGQSLLISIGYDKNNIMNTLMIHILYSVASAAAHTHDLDDPACLGGIIKRKYSPILEFFYILVHISFSGFVVSFLSVFSVSALRSLSSLSSKKFSLTSMKFSYRRRNTLFFFSVSFSAWTSFA